MISPNIAKEALTPPMVGSVITLINGRPAFASLAKAAEVLAICIKENNDSCIRAPPDVAKQISALWVFKHSSTAAQNLAPTTEPMEPAMKSNSKAHATTGKPFKVPLITTKASFSPDFF